MISHSYSKHKAMGNERKLIKKYLASGKHLKVLELGSGYGSFASLCKEFNVDYTGIDMGQEGIKYCNTQYPQKNFRFILRHLCLLTEVFCFLHGINTGLSARGRFPIRVTNEHGQRPALSLNRYMQFIN